MKNLYLIVGPSASGKTTLAYRLERTLGLKPVESYTTRPQRKAGERGHIFVTVEEFAAIPNRIADNSYSGYRYAATQALLDESQIYVVEPKGHAVIMTAYHRPERLRTILLTAPQQELERRMRRRGDTEESIQARRKADRPLFAGIEAVADCIISGLSKDAAFVAALRYIKEQEKEKY